MRGERWQGRLRKRENVKKIERDEEKVIKV